MDGITHLILDGLDRIQIFQSQKSPPVSLPEELASPGSSSEDMQIFIGLSFLNFISNF